MVGFLKWGATSTALITLVGCGHGSKLYSTEDAKRAFAKEGFLLVATYPQQPGFLTPKSSEPFTVVVARTEADARYAYGKLHREATGLTYDLRSRNVITISDTGLSHSEKRRLRRAMQRLRG